MDTGVAAIQAVGLAVDVDAPLALAAAAVAARVRVLPEAGVEIGDDVLEFVPGLGRMEVGLRNVGHRRLPYGAGGVLPESGWAR